MLKLNETRQYWTGVLAKAAVAAVLLAPLGPSAVKADGGNNGNGQQKFTVCHKGVTTIVISKAALDTHLAHGDTQGPCVVTTTN